MNSLPQVLRDAVDVLVGEGVGFALVGGIAVSARTEPRFTRDIELAVAVEGDVEAERLIHAMIQRGWRVEAQLEQETTRRLATMRTLPPGATRTSGVVVDLLFASTGIEPEIVAAAQPLEVFAGVTVPVARAHHLLAMKLLSRDDVTRPLDRADALALLATLDAKALEQTRAALLLMTQRGFHRGRDLLAELDRIRLAGS